MFKKKSLSPRKDDYYASPSTKKKLVVGKRIKRLNELKDIADYEDDPFAGYDDHDNLDEEDLVRLEAQARAARARPAPSTPKKNRSFNKMKKVLGDKTRQLRRGSTREKQTSISDDPHELGTANHVFSPTNNRRGRLRDIRRTKSDDGLFEMRKSILQDQNKDARFNAVDSSYNQVIDKYKQLGSGKKKIIDQEESKERRKNIAESLLGFLDDMYESQF